MKSFFSRNNLIFWFFVLIPLLWVFSKILFGNLPAWGDAPFFYPSGLRELFSEPLVWTERGINFGGVNQLLWLSPIMFLIGVLNHFLYWGSDILVRLLFYLPSVVMAALGPFFLTRYLKLSKITQFFSVLVYLFNTYYLLIIDGGQVGVALAYGLFPFVLLFGRKLVDKTSLNSFFQFLLVSTLLVVCDPRVFVVAALTLFVFQVLDNVKKLPTILLAFFVIILLSSYWLLPLLKIESTNLGLDVSSLQLSSSLNSLLLSSPHWPNNIFGKIVQPQFYFVLIPFLLFGKLLYEKKNKFLLHTVLIFLFFAFVAKGSTPPLGGWYDFLVNRLPLGFAFRDSSKFFIPLVLLGGILIGETITSFRGFVFPVVGYGLILLFIYPALVGRLNFNLSSRRVDNSFQTIYEKLDQEPDFFRTIWFPEKPPLAFDLNNKPALDARNLVLAQPFAFLNASEDPFNLLNNPTYVDWLRLLGTKYIFLPGDLRNLTPSQKDIENWDSLKSLVASSPGLVKEDWGTSFPVYKIENSLPKSFVVDNIVAVVGPMLAGGSQLTLSVYLEDGKWDPNFLNGKDKGSIKILLNGKEKLDLTMSLLQKHFVSTKEYDNSGWAYYKPEEYLKYKYELLIKGLTLNDFDYGKGIFFSTVSSEKMETSLKVSKKDNYVLTLRGMKKEGSGKIKVIFNNEEKEIDLKEGDFGWNVLGQFTLTKGTYKLLLQNGGGLQVINAIAIVPKGDFDKAGKTSDVLIANFGLIKENEIGNLSWQELKLKSEGTLKYTFDIPKKGSWIIFTDNFSPLWQMRRWIFYTTPIPVYSMVNGFYLDPDWQDLHIEYRGQDSFRWGLFFSGVSLLSLLIIYLLFLERNDKRKTLNDNKN